MKYKVTEIQGTGTFDVHAADCDDLSKRPVVPMVFEEDTVEDVVDLWLDDQLKSQGYTEDDVRIMDCAKH